jgi:hypothetical protein
LPTKYLTLDDSNIHILVFDSLPVTVDRSVVQEDQIQGQVIRAYTIDVYRSLMRIVIGVGNKMSILQYIK